MGHVDLSYICHIHFIAGWALPPFDCSHDCGTVKGVAKKEAGSRLRSDLQYLGYPRYGHMGYRGKI